MSESGSEVTKCPCLLPHPPHCSLPLHIPFTALLFFNLLFSGIFHLSRGFNCLNFPRAATAQMELCQVGRGSSALPCCSSPLRCFGSLLHTSAFLALHLAAPVSPQALRIIPFAWFLNAVTIISPPSMTSSCPLAKWTKFKCQEPS